jgi:hypothetical protein
MKLGPRSWIKNTPKLNETTFHKEKNKNKKHCMGYIG